MAPLSSLSPMKLAPLTFSSLEPLLALETAWRPSRPFLHQFAAPDVFSPGAPACTWNCMALLSSFSLSIWRPWRFLPWTPCLHLKLHGAPLVLISVNLAPLTFSSLEPLLALETVWRPSRPYLRQFGAADVFFPGSSSCLHLKLWRPSRPYLRHFSAPDVFFPGAPACTWNCMAPLSSLSPSIWRPWRFLPWIQPLLAFETMAPLSSLSPSLWRPWRFLQWSPCLHLKLHGAPLVILILLSFFLFSFLLPLFCHFFLSYSLLFPLFSSFSPSLFLSFSFFLSFWRPFGDPGGPRPPKKLQWSIWSLLGNILNAFLVSIDSESMKI